MSDLSFSALIRFPNSAYFDFNSSINGIAIVDSISRESENYHANISFGLPQMSECIAAIQSVEGTIVEIIPEKEIKWKKSTPKMVRNYTKKAVKVTGSRKQTKIAELREYLTTGWKTADDVAKHTGWKNSTIYARFTGLKKKKMLRSKDGPGGKKLYRLAAVAA